MIELQILGEIHLRTDDGVEVDALLRQPKRLALLAYLASPAPGTWHRRDMLLALFWPDLDQSHARTSLRNGLYVIRQAVGEQVLRNRGDEEISIDPAALSTDLSIVWKALQDHDPERALEHYGGELLPGLFPPDSEGFQRWLDLERTRLKVAVTNAAMARIDELTRLGDSAKALLITRRISQVQPDDETVVRRLMTIQETMGDRAGALSTFESYRSRLATDFEAEPAPETVAVAARLRASSGPEAVRPKGTNAPNAPTIMNAPLALSVQSADESVSLRTLEPPAERPSSSRRFVFAGAAILLLIVAIGSISWRSLRTAQPLQIGSSSPLTADEGLQVEPAISPNGRLVAFAKGNSNLLRIYVQKIGGGAAWPLSGDSTRVELMPEWSPDNDEILFLSRNNAYVSPSLGGTARVVVKGTEGDGMVRSASWSPAGDSVAIVRNDSLFIHPLDGQGSRFVGTGFQLHSCMWSPNGKWIACISGNLIAFTPGPLFGNDAPTSIVLFPAAGGKPVALTDNKFENESPGWSADGNFLWILSNRDGASGEVYAIPVKDDGHAKGPPIRIGLKAGSISLSRARIAYSVPSRKSNIWSIPIPAGNAVTLAGATQVTTGNQVIELLSASSDGHWLVYDSNLRGDADIYRFPIGGGASERLTTDSRPEYAPSFSPDGNEIAWQRFVNGERHLFVKRIDSDAEEEILPSPGDQGVPQWSPDGSSIVAWSHNKESGAVFVLKRASNGHWRQAWRLNEGQLPVWSPDGKSIAFVLLDGSVQSIPADSGAMHALYTPRAGTSDPLAIFLHWGPDAGTIYMMGQSATQQAIWALPVATGRPRLVVRTDDLVPRSFLAAFTVAGSRFYFPLDERFSNINFAELRH